MDNFSRLSIKTNDGIDWIIELPDPILTHILSFLTTKEAMHTCIISKRWKNVWVSVPMLNFDLKEFGEGYGDYGSDFYEDPEPSFHRYLCGVLENVELLCLDSLQYRWAADGGSHEVSMAWLHHVAPLMPLMISIFIEDHPCLNFPASFFSCASLESLKLTIYNIPREIISPKSVSLPSLKVLQPGGLVLPDNFMKLIILGCPVLQELVLGKCTMESSEISSNVLKKLVIEFSYYFGPKPMQISCPGLQS